MRRLELERTPNVVTTAPSISVAFIRSSKVGIVVSLPREGVVAFETPEMFLQEPKRPPSLRQNDADEVTTRVRCCP